MWATILTVLVNRFLVGPRADLRLTPSTESVEDIERLTRENEGNYTGLTWIPAGWARRVAERGTLPAAGVDR
jgi:hypothetical protein